MSNQNNNGSKVGNIILSIVFAVIVTVVTFLTIKIL